MENDKMTFNGLMEFLKDHQDDNEFLQSLWEQYETTGTLTMNQTDCVYDVYEAMDLAKWMEPFAKQNKFFKSLRQQYKERGSLSEKQMKLVREARREYNNFVQWYKTFDGSSTFVESLYEQITERGSLSPKQWKKLVESYPRLIVKNDRGMRSEITIPAKV